MIRTSAQIYQRQGSKIRIKVHKRTVQGNRDNAEHINSLSPTNGQAIGTHQSVARAIPAILGQRTTKQLAYLSTSGRIRA